MGLLYKPDCPWSDEKGFIEKFDWYAYKSMHTEDKRMMIGNKPVVLYYNPDGMEPTQNMCDGKYYTSKKKFRNTTKAYGCIEVGNETATLLKPRKPIKLDKRQRKEDIKRAIWELKNGRDIKTEVKEAVSKT